MAVCAFDIIILNQLYVESFSLSSSRLFVCTETDTVQVRALARLLDESTES